MIALRSVSDEDREFLLRVYAAAREIELAAVPWDDAMKRAFVEHQLDAQRLHYAQEYPNVSHDVVLDDGEPVGRLFLSRGDGQTAILDIAILPEFRRRGIASELISRLQTEGRSLRVFVEPYNPAQGFFKAMDFQIVHRDEANLRFEWTPPAA